MSSKLPWNVQVRCLVQIKNNTALAVPHIIHEGGCFRPPVHLLTLRSMFGYHTFDVICRRKHKTIEVVEIVEAISEPVHIGQRNMALYTRLEWSDQQGKFKKVYIP